MNKVIIIRWCEIHLKGKNRHFFEKLLEDNIKYALKDYKYTFVKIQGRYLLEDFDEFLVDDFIISLSKVSGIHTVSVAELVNSEIEEISKTAVELSSELSGTFKVETRRANKKFPINSTDVSKFVGGQILKNNSNLKVDVKNPNHVVNIDIREGGETLVFTNTIKMMGGMPIGSSGRGLLMLSGGIDSPVAGYMMAKRGMRLEAIHFHSYPYTNESAKEKVISLANQISEYTNGIKLHVVKFTEIQEEIHKNCPEEYMITIMRRFMMRIAEKIAKSISAQAIITGECLGQVASQTIESLTSSQSAIVMPVLRPLIAFDKLEIIEISEKIGTYETSILPFEDCCTVFLPKYPLIKPRLDRVEAVEKALDIDTLVDNALKTVETIKFGTFIEE